MYTFEEAVEKYKATRLKGLPGLLKRYEDIYTDKHPSYCPHCGWYYPHDNWKRDCCPVCLSKDIIKQDNENSIPTFGLFA